MLFNVEEEIHIIQNDIEIFDGGLVKDEGDHHHIADHIGLQNSKKYLIASVPILTQKSQFD